MELSTKAFQQSQEDQKLISIHLYGQDSFHCGYILDFNETHITIQDHTRFGEADGVVVEKIENIECIDIDDKYNKAFEFLVKNQVKLRKMLSDAKSLEIKASNPREFMMECAENIIPCQIYFTNDEAIHGFVRDISFGDVNIHCLGSMGTDLGMSIYKIKDVSSVTIGQKETVKRTMLFNWKKGLIKTPQPT